MTSWRVKNYILPQKMHGRIKECFGMWCDIRNSKKTKECCEENCLEKVRVRGKFTIVNDLFEGRYVKDPFESWRGRVVDPKTS